MQEGLHLGTELCSADTEELQAAARHFPEFRPEKDIQQPWSTATHQAQAPVGIHRPAYRFVDLLDDERDGQDDGRADLPHGLQEYRRYGHSFQIIHLRADA